MAGSMRRRLGQLLHRGNKHSSACVAEEEAAEAQAAARESAAEEAELAALLAKCEVVAAELHAEKGVEEELRCKTAENESLVSREQQEAKEFALVSQRAEARRAADAKAQAEADAVARGRLAALRAEVAEASAEVGRLESALAAQNFSRRILAEARIERGQAELQSSEALLDRARKREYAEHKSLRRQLAAQRVTAEELSAHQERLEVHSSEAIALDLKVQEMRERARLRRKLYWEDASFLTVGTDEMRALRAQLGSRLNKVASLEQQLEVACAQRSSCPASPALDPLAESAVAKSSVIPPIAAVAQIVAPLRSLPGPPAALFSPASQTRAPKVLFASSPGASGPCTPPRSQSLPGVEASRSPRPGARAVLELERDRLVLQVEALRDRCSELGLEDVADCAVARALEALSVPEASERSTALRRKLFPASATPPDRRVDDEADAERRRAAAAAMKAALWEDMTTIRELEEEKRQLDAAYRQVAQTRADLGRRLASLQLAQPMVTPSIGVEHRLRRLE